MSSELLKEISATLRAIQNLKHDELDPAVRKELRRLDKSLQNFISNEAAGKKNTRKHLLELLTSISRWAFTIDCIRRGIDDLMR